MKTSLLVGFILFYALSVTVNAAKGGLSKDEQKKLLDEINKDRMAAFGGELGKMTYDTELEKKAAEYDCVRSPPVWLQWNGVAQDFWDEVDPMHNPNRRYFDFRIHSIGCSKDIKCSTTLKKDARVPEKFDGKEKITVGGCFIGPMVHEADKIKIDKSVIPKGAKYGDLLGITLSSSGRVFNLTVFVAIMVFYF